MGGRSGEREKRKEVARPHTAGKVATWMTRRRVGRGNERARWNSTGQAEGQMGGGEVQWNRVYSLCRAYGYALFFLSFVDSAPFCSRVHHIARHDKITLTGAVMRDIRALRKIRTFFLPEDFHFQLDRAPKFHLSPDWHLGLSELAGSCRFLANPTRYRVTRLARRLLFRSDAIDAIRWIDRSQSVPSS